MAEALQLRRQHIRLAGLPAPITLRPAGPEDAAAVAALLLDSRKTLLPYLPQRHSDAEVQRWVAGQLIPGRGVSVAAAPDRLLGVLALSRDAEHCGWIDQLYLQPDAILRGLGSALLAQALDLLGPPVRLYTFQLNTGARRFYQRHGFEATAFSDGQRNEERTPDVLFEWRGAARG
jgi:GNAT superfamily N-acetyltransferase